MNEKGQAEKLDSQEPEKLVPEQEDLEIVGDFISLEKLANLDKKIEKAKEENPNLLTNDKVQELLEKSVPLFNKLTGEDLKELSNNNAHSYFKHKKQTVYGSGKEKFKEFKERVQNLYNTINEAKKDKKIEVRRKDIKLYTFIENAWENLSDEQKEGYASENDPKGRGAKFNFIVEMAKKRFKNIELNCQTNNVENAVNQNGKINPDSPLSPETILGLEEKDKNFIDPYVFDEKGDPKKKLQYPESYEKTEHKKLEKEFNYLVLDQMYLLDGMVREFGEKENVKAHDYFYQKLSKLKSRLPETAEKLKEISLQGLKESIESQRQKLKKYENVAEGFRLAETVGALKRERKKEEKAKALREHEEELDAPMKKNFWPDAGRDMKAVWSFVRHSIKFFSKNRQEEEFSADELISNEKIKTLEELNKEIEEIESKEAICPNCKWVFLQMQKIDFDKCPNCNKVVPVLEKLVRLKEEREKFLEPEPVIDLPVKEKESDKKTKEEDDDRWGDLGIKPTSMAKPPTSAPPEKPNGDLYLPNKVIEDYFGYTDVIDQLRAMGAPVGTKEEEIEKRKKNPTTWKYASGLEKVISEQGKERVDEIIKEMIDNCLKRIREYGIEPSPNTLSKTWAAWDIGKQNYFFTHQNEADKRYLIADPLSPEKQNEIVNRHIGWEVYENYIGSKSSEKEYMDVKKLESHPQFKEIEQLLKKSPKKDGQLSSLDLAKLGSFIGKEFIVAQREPQPNSEATENKDKLEFSPAVRDKLEAGGYDFEHPIKHEVTLFSGKKEIFIQITNPDKSAPLVMFARNKFDSWQQEYLGQAEPRLEPLAPQSKPSAKQEGLIDIDSTDFGLGPDDGAPEKEKKMNPETMTPAEILRYLNSENKPNFNWKDVEQSLLSQETKEKVKFNEVLEDRIVSSVSEDDAGDPEKLLQIAIENFFGGLIKKEQAPKKPVEATKEKPNQAEKEKKEAEKKQIDEIREASEKLKEKIQKADVIGKTKTFWFKKLDLINGDIREMILRKKKGGDWQSVRDEIKDGLDRWNKIIDETPPRNK